MTTKGMLIRNFALNIYWSLSKPNTTQRLPIRNFALVYIGDLISIPCTKPYLSTKGCTLNWSLNATYKILSVHQRMYSELSLKQKQFPKRPPFSLKIFICPLRKKVIIKAKTDSTKFQTFLSENYYLHKNKDVYPPPKQKEID